MSRTLKPLFTWRSAVADSDLPPTARHVALTLSLHMSERGDSAFPSLDTQARETGLNRATVARALKRLGEEGWLDRVPGGGRGHPTVYTATLPKQSHSETVAQENRFPNDEKQSQRITGNSRTVRPEDVRLGRTEDVRPVLASRTRSKNGNGRPTEDQTYLIGHILDSRPEHQGSFTFAALTKLNQRHGVEAVTDALRFLRYDDAEGVDNLYGWIEARCRKEVTA